MSRLKRNSAQYDAAAEIAMRGLLEAEYAAVWREIEAKLSEGPYTEPSTGDVFPYGINPHHLTNARRELIAQGIVVEHQVPTHGGRPIQILAVANQRRRKTAISRTAARKRLLHARYLSWADPSTGRPNLIGAGGELVTRESLQAALLQLPPGAGRYMLDPSLAPGNVTNLFGSRVPGGPLDDLAYLSVLDRQKVPAFVTLMIEVKNLRTWIYPSAAELYQLLDKAARVQAQHPHQAILPILVCRRAHFTTTQMGRDLGFVTAETIKQFILPHSDLEGGPLDEVRNELSYDIVLADGPSTDIVDRLTSFVPSHAAYYARQWASTSQKLAPYYQQLRDASLGHHARDMALKALKQDAERLPRVNGGWI